MATSVLNDLRGVYHRTWWALMLRGLLGLAVGIYIFARPLDSVAAFALVIAFWALFVGSVEPRKNLAGLVRAIPASVHTRVRVVCVRPLPPCART